jgi:tRNA G46 methylase TrmB
MRYGGLLGGETNTRYAHIGARETANCDYEALSRIFANRIKASDVLVDIGCGKGRVINWWLHNGCRNRIIGIELDEEIANRTRQRLRRYKNVSIITGDAIQNLTADGTLFYLYNPFKEHIMEAFKKRLIS